MLIEIPKFVAIRWMVFESGKPLRGFVSKQAAEDFASADDEYEVRQIPKTYQRFEAEEAPF